MGTQLCLTKMEKLKSLLSCQFAMATQENTTGTNLDIQITAKCGHNLVGLFKLVVLNVCIMAPHCVEEETQN